MCALGGCYVDSMSPSVTVTQLSLFDRKLESNIYICFIDFILL